MEPIMPPSVPPETPPGTGRLAGVAESLFEFLRVGIVVSDERGRVVDSNLAARTLFGLNPVGAQAGTFEMPKLSFVRADGTALPPADHPRERALREGRGIADEQIGMVGPGGGITWLKVSAMPVSGLGVVSISRDVTHDRQSEADVRHHIDQLDAFFDTNLELLVIFDSEGRVVRFNPAWETLLGYDSEKIDGARILDFVHPADMEGTLGALARMRTPMEVVAFVNRIRQRDGNFRLLEWRATARDDLVYATARDVTDQRLAEAELRESEARFRAIFEQAAVGVAEVDLESGQFQRVNQRFCEILGYSEEELHKRTFQDITHPEDLPKSVDGLKKFVAGDVAEFTCEKRYIHKDGRVVWVSLQVKLLGKPGQISGHFVSVIQDITERKDADETLRESLVQMMESNQRLNFQVTRMPLGYITWDLDFRVTQWNASAERIFGWPASEAIGKHAYDLIVPMDARPAVARAWNECVGSGDFDHRVINDNLTRDGRRIVCEWFNCPWLDAQGKIVGSFSMVHDVTEKQRLEEKVLHAQKMASMGSFAGGVAHDMSQVLRSIMDQALALQKASPDAETLGSIVRACHKGRTLVRGLLDFARQDLANATVFDLNELLNEQLRMLASSIHPGIRIDREFDPRLPPVKGDELALSGACMHLLLNAIDAMPKGGVLTVRTRQSGEHAVKIDVDDTGCGMSKEILDHAMEPLFTTKSRGKGAGLGLPAVYGAVQAHQGDLEIHSEPKRGTQVQITLPVIAVAGVHSSGPDQSASESADDRPSVPPQPPVGLRILLVDDDDQVQTAVTAQLRRLGHCVTIAVHGQEALDKFQAGLDVDLVLLDIDMPVLDGTKTLPRMRALRPGLPVIVETGNLDERIEGLVREHADIAVLIKPFSLSELKAAIDTNRH
jgi:PAS domain S-box-containing protein